MYLWFGYQHCSLKFCTERFGPIKWTKIFYGLISRERIELDIILISLGIADTQNIFLRVILHQIFLDCCH